MKKSLFALCVLAVLIGSFLGSVWVHNWRAGEKEGEQAGRRVLYYVDPMNPAHTSNEPGLAPCGMPMEPVYEEDESGGAGSSLRYMPPGTAKISTEKQQLIGIQVEKVEMTSHAHALRTLGRVAADENLTYRLIANTEGWVQDVQGSTTGSLVQENQLMALIHTYSVDFYTWQQQYLTYTAYQRPPGTQVPRVRLPRAQQFEGQQVEAQQLESHLHGSQPVEMPQPEAHRHELEQPEGMRPEVEQPAAPSSGAPPSMAQEPGAPPGEVRRDRVPKTGAQDFYTKQLSTRNVLVDNYAYRSKLELLNAGLREEQLEELARTGQYQTQVEIRSPVRGFVLSRNVTPRQKSEKGAELFSVADLTRVWVLADVFEREASFVRPGTAARVTIPHRETTIEATVTDVLPQFDKMTRTLKVRLEVNNSDFALIPDMFVDVEFLITLPPAITVPVDAVLDAGLRRTVFVDVGNGFFEPRTVTTGWRRGGRVEVTQGIMPGERIVVSGNFLVDSESRMKLAAAGILGAPVKDPACGMEVYPDKARKDGLFVEQDGGIVYFCSSECKAQFQKEHGHNTEKPAPEQRPAQPVTPDEQSMSGFWRDPVCGMLLHASKARELGFKSEHQGKTYYFCSDQCKRQFDGARRRDLEKPAAGPDPKSVPGRGEHQHD